MPDRITTTLPNKLEYVPVAIASAWKMADALGFTADEAVRVARLGRELLRDLGNPGSEWVKLEVLGDTRTLLPDPIGTLDATIRLVAEGFTVLVYTSDDPVVARRLKEAGAASVMPAVRTITS